LLKLKSKYGEDAQMKVALSLLTAAVVPFGFVVSAIAAVGYLLANRRKGGARVPSPTGAAKCLIAAAA
jgi:hypothetical protein